MQAGKIVRGKKKIRKRLQKIFTRIVQEKIYPREVERETKKKMSYKKKLRVITPKAISTLRGATITLYSKIIN